MSEVSLSNTLAAIASILDSVKYECSSREYTLDDDAMGWVFHCRDLAQETLRLHNEEREKSKEDAMILCNEVGHMWIWMPKNLTICMRCGLIEEGK